MIVWKVEKRSDNRKGVAFFYIEEETRGKCGDLNGGKPV